MMLPNFFKLAPKTILLQWEAVITKETQQRIQQTERLVQHYFSEEIIETTPTYNELAIYWKEDISISACKEKLDDILLQKMDIESIASTRLITIPVCYETDVALDLSSVANFHSISESDVIKLHTAPTYTISFIGFLPGFPYLKGLSEKLITPRKTTPRTKVVAGSVGIGGKQTGIYPNNSPGGWNIIGRSPLDFFSVNKEQPSLLRAGDTLKFQPISTGEFDLISLEVASGIYQLKTQTL